MENETEVKKIKKPKSKARKIIDWVITGVFGCLFLAVSGFQIAANVTKGNNFGVPNFNGHQILVVLTDSMVPDYPVSTAIFVDKVDKSTLEVGNDITFYYAPWEGYMSNPIVTHRIREVLIDSETGRRYFIVGGINKNSENCMQTDGSKDCTSQSQTVSEDYVLGKVTGSSRFIGAVYKFISSAWGLIILLLIPCLYLIISSVLDIYKAAKEPEEALEIGANSSNDPLSTLSDADKERLKQEMLDEMLGGKKNDK